MKGVTVVDHPLVQHKLTIMRNKETSTAGFRRLLREISLLLCYEVTRNLELTTTRIETPLEAMDAPTLEGKGSDDHLLTAPGGGPLRIGNWRGRVFDPAVKGAGVARQVAGDMVRPHDLRHTCASLHIKYGTPPKVLSEMLGHASVSITLDRYGHLYPGDAHTYVDRLGEVALQSRAVWLRSESSARVVGLPPVAGEKGL